MDKRNKDKSDGPTISGDNPEDYIVDDEVDQQLADEAYFELTGHHFDENEEDLKKD